MANGIANGAEIIQQQLQLNSSDLFSGVFENLPPELANKISFITDLSKWILIATLVYLVILIIQKLMKIRESYRFKIMADSLAEINKKMDKVIERLPEKRGHDKGSVGGAKEGRGWWGRKREKGKR